MSSRRSLRRPARGAAALEFAIIVPLLVAILCGTIDWGYYFFTREIVVNASRQGARVGTLQFDPPANATDEACSAARDYLERSFGADRAALATVQAVALDGSSCPAQSSCVRISYPVGGSVTGLLGSLVPHDIVAYAEMRK